MKKALEQEVSPPKTLKKGWVYRTAFFLKDKPERVTLPQLVGHFLGTVVGWPYLIIFGSAFVVQAWWILLWTLVIVLLIVGGCAAYLLWHSQPVQRRYIALKQFWTTEYQVV